MSSTFREFAGLTTNVSVFGAYFVRVQSARNSLCGFAYPVRVGGHDAEATAVVDVQMREIERQHAQDTAIDQDVLVVIADQVVGSASHDDSGIETAQLQLAQTLFAAAVGKCDQGGHLDAPLRRRLQRRLDVLAIEAEDGNLHAFLRALDGREQRRHAVGGLNDQFHNWISLSLWCVARHSSAKSDHIRRWIWVQRMNRLKPSTAVGAAARYLNHSWLTRIRQERRRV